METLTTLIWIINIILILLAFYFISKWISRKIFNRRPKGLSRETEVFIRKMKQEQNVKDGVE